MRYAVVEILPPESPNSTPVVKWVATDMCHSSAADCIMAWGYQAGFKGGYMEIIEDTQEAFDARKSEADKYAFLTRRDLK